MPHASQSLAPTVHLPLCASCTRHRQALPPQASSLVSTLDPVALGTLTALAITAVICWLRPGTPMRRPQPQGEDAPHTPKWLSCVTMFLKVMAPALVVLGCFPCAAAAARPPPEV